MVLFGFRIDKGDLEIVEEFVKETNKRIEYYTLPKNPFSNDSLIYQVNKDLYVAHLKPVFFNLGLGNRFFLFFMLKQGMKKKGWKGKAQMLKKDYVDDLLTTKAFPRKTIEEA